MLLSSKSGIFAVYEEDKVPEKFTEGNGHTVAKLGASNGVKKEEKKVRWGHPHTTGNSLSSVKRAFGQARHTIFGVSVVSLKTTHRELQLTQTVSIGETRHTHVISYAEDACHLCFHGRRASDPLYETTSELCQKSDTNDTE